MLGRFLFNQVLFVWYCIYLDQLFVIYIYLFSSIADPYRFKSDDIVTNMLSKYYTPVAKTEAIPDSSKSKLSDVEIVLIVLGVAVLVIGLGWHLHLCP